MTNIPEDVKKTLLKYQQNEITEYHIYSLLAKTLTDEDNRTVVRDIAADELRHYNQWKQYTGRDVKPIRHKVWWYYGISRIFGFTFGVKLLEQGEENAQVNYAALRDVVDIADDIADDEGRHEEELLDLLSEDRLRYTGSVVLGLNDALVELTGALAGLTLALRSTALVALTGLITGIAAALSMAASEYLSTKAEETEKAPLKASLYTGTAYVITVGLLILPYLVLDNYYAALACTLILAVGIIGVFNYYIAVAKGLDFKSRFLEMAGLSMGVAFLSFFIGILVRMWLGVEV